MRLTLLCCLTRVIGDVYDIFCLFTFCESFIQTCPFKSTNFVLHNYFLSFILILGV